MNFTLLLAIQGTLIYQCVCEESGLWLVSVFSVLYMFCRLAVVPVEWGDKGLQLCSEIGTTKCQRYDRVKGMKRLSGTWSPCHCSVSKPMLFSDDTFVRGPETCVEYPRVFIFVVRWFCMYHLVCIDLGICVSRWLEMVQGCLSLRQLQPIKMSEVVGGCQKPEEWLCVCHRGIEWKTGGFQVKPTK